VTLSVTYFVAMVLTEQISNTAVDRGERVDPDLLACYGQALSR
jgi:hypothetical protein